MTLFRVKGCDFRHRSKPHAPTQFLTKGLYFSSHFGRRGCIFSMILCRTNSLALCTHFRSRGHISDALLSRWYAKHASKATIESFCASREKFYEQKLLTIFSRTESAEEQSKNDQQAESVLHDLTASRFLPR